MYLYFLILFIFFILFFIKNKENYASIDSTSDFYEAIVYMKDTSGLPINMTYSIVLYANKQNCNDKSCEFVINKKDIEPSLIRKIEILFHDRKNNNVINISKDTTYKTELNKKLEYRNFEVDCNRLTNNGLYSKYLKIDKNTSSCSKDKFIMADYKGKNINKALYGQNSDYSKLINRLNKSNKQKYNISLNYS